VYGSGLEQDDEIRQLDGQRIASADDITSVLRRHKPGDRIDLVFVNRTARPTTSSITLGEDPHIEIVAAEAAGGTLTAAQKAFRDLWLEPKP
jgi:PDZ domain-containing secreted protein